MLVVSIIGETIYMNSKLFAVSELLHKNELRTYSYMSLTKLQIKKAVAKIKTGTPDKYISI